jgi:acyl-CoA dehydrogenase
VLAIAPTGGHACIRAKAADGHLEISGDAAQIAWGRHAETTVALAHDDRGQAFVAAVPRQGLTICEMDDIAHRPSDRLIFFARVPARDFAMAPEWLDAVALRAAGAAAAVMTMAGAIGALLDMTTRYCGERVQFGRPLAKFQAVQQQLAILAEQSAAASGAADIATRAFGQGIDINQVAAAKARAGEAAGKAAAIAHQLHGAIGFTEEHRLHFYSRLLWALRDECGHEEEWRLRLGKSLLAEGAADLWPALAAL